MTTAAAEPIRLLLAEFEEVVSCELRALGDKDQRLKLVASGVSRDQLAETIGETAPQVVIINLNALTSPFELRDLHTTFPGTRLVLLADHVSSAQRRQLLAFGAGACLSKNAAARELLDAIHSVSPGREIEPDAATLTQSEVEVLELLRSGRSNAEIAQALNISIETVRTHARRIYRKLGVKTRRELRGLG